MRSVIASVRAECLPYVAWVERRVQGGAHSFLYGIVVSFRKRSLIYLQLFSNTRLNSAERFIPQSCGALSDKKCKLHILSIRLTKIVLENDCDKHTVRLHSRVRVQTPRESYTLIRTG